MQNQVENQFSLIHEERDMGLVLSGDAKPRLKWTIELHQHFVDAVSQLGGPDKATPKMVMRVMGVPGLTLYHLKSHLQKYRFSRNQLQSVTCSSNKKADCTVPDTEIRGVHTHVENLEKNHPQINESLQIAKTLQMQMEVQQKLHEQIEVQRHLQLQIEAQGKYLQSVLEKAQETLAGYDYNSCLGLEAAKAELFELASLVNVECPNSSTSELKETQDLRMQGTRLMRNNFVPHQPQLTDCSMDSCLTSSESSDRKDEKLHNLQINSAYDWNEDAERNGTSVLQLIEINSNCNNLSKTHLSNRTVGDKRTRSTPSDGTGIGIEQQITEELPHQKNSDNQSKRFRFLEDLDLNSQYQSEIDLEFG